PAGRLFDSFGAAQEAEAEETAAGIAEGIAGSDAEIGLVDELQAELLSVRFAVDGEEHVERTWRFGEADATRRGEPVAHDLPAAAGALQLKRDEFVTLVEGDGGCALHEGRHARGRVLDQVFDHLAELRRR